MLDPKALSEYAISHLDSSQEEIQRNLNLFQSFKRVYDQNPALVTEILNLDQPGGQPAPSLGNLSYVLGMVTNHQPALITNLLLGRSQVFLSPSEDLAVWTLGRDPSQAALSVRDRRLSRCHAAIHHDQSHGFRIYDLGSTNGTYVNGVRIRHGYALQDGDHVRLGSLNFRFFSAREFRRSVAPLPEVLQLIEGSTIPTTTPIAVPEESPASVPRNETKRDNFTGEETVQFLRRRSESKRPSPPRS
jgi:pSer/pThr/pTyr-binding forkhead associated (FHA) protein